MDKGTRLELEARAKDIRKLTIEEIGNLGVGHIGGAMSVVELLALLYFHRMRIDPARPGMEDRDWLVLSKGHAGPALYTTLALRGFFPLEWLATLNKGGTRLPSHCDRNRTPGIDMTTGSLGQGFSAAVGIALAHAMDGRDARTYAIIGDGESDEGQVWEAAMFAGNRRLSRLIAFTDYNKQQLDGFTAEVADLEDLEAKWRAFRWNVLRVDGHDIAALDAAIGAAYAQDAMPTMIVMDTVKGKGCFFAEGLPANHNMSYTSEQAREAVARLGD
ncbi:MAG: transketolase [Spirochaetes bacterium]|nr:transketolase [Spirochaetota bacterium]MBU1079488.1 transketolase [Spirochaetota bacterium]